MKKIISTFVILITASLFLWKCEPPEIASPTTTTKDSTTTTVDSVSLLISNQLSNDAGNLTFFLFPPTANDYQNAANGIKLKQNRGVVPMDSAVNFQVPVGIWKIVCMNDAGVIDPMDNNNGDWVKSTFVKGQAYSITVTSTQLQKLWTPSYTSDPAIIIQ